MGLLKAAEQPLAECQLYVAFSGGADSVCLAHQMAEQLGPDRVVCLHVNHGLDPEASQRADEAAGIARHLGLAFHCFVIDQPISSNREALARERRYQYLAQPLRTGDVLVTAHHADDLAETLIIRMLRGAGLFGLAGIKRHQPFAQGTLIRPLLTWSKSQISDYVSTQRLPFIHDPTNDVLSLDRNFIRHRVMPLLSDRFGGAAEALNRSARLNQQAATALEDYIKKDLEKLKRPGQRLHLPSNIKDNSFLCAELIRHWCLQSSLPPPPGKPLESFVGQIITSHADRQPKLEWPHGCLYFYNQHLWLETTVAESTNVYTLDWDGLTPLSLPNGLGVIHLEPCEGWRHLGPHPAFKVCSGHPNESIELLPNGPVLIKTLMADAKIPPWQRPLWPRLWFGNRLLACGDLWQSPVLEGALRWHCPRFPTASAHELN